MGEVIEAQPWLPRTFLDAFASWNTKTWKMFEFGSGFSTTWFAERVHTLWTLEHDRSWHGAVKKACDRKGLKNVHCLSIELGTAYQNRIEKFEDGFFDFVLVDGRDRVKCFMQAFPKVSKVIALDNGYRDRYKSVLEMMAKKKNWEPRVAKWTEPIIKDGVVKPIIPVNHCLLWIRKGTRLSG